MRISIILFLSIFCPICLAAQGSGLPIGGDTYHIMDRLEIKSGLRPPFHSALKYYTRGDIAHFALQIDTCTTLNISSKDEADLQYIFRDNNEWLVLPSDNIPLTRKKNEYQREYVDSSAVFYRVDQNKGEASITTNRSHVDASFDSPRYEESRRPILKQLYKTPANLFELNRPGFYIKVNPILNFRMAQERNDPELVFLNQRGIEIRGGVDERIYFYSNIQESQARFAQYVNDRIERDDAVPGAGFYKAYNSSIFNINNGYDFLNAQAHVGFNITRHVGMQFGHGQNFIGNGYRSLLLSDYANNYFYLKFNTRVWRLHFQNIFAELAVQGSEDDRGDLLIPKKYMAAHYLSCYVTPKLTIGLYEAVIFSRNNNFEFQYLNPVILYRTAEQALGSADNILIGIDAKWNLLNRFSLYGQLMVDEFKFSELVTDNNDWWANKYGLQVGLKYIDVLGVDHLDLQVEYNKVRPYTYSHRDSSAIYAHFNQPLAHPLGANFNEVLFKLRYQPLKKLVIEPRVIMINYGADTDDDNWGENILLSSSPNTVPRVYGNLTGQGEATSVLIAGIDVSYQLFHNVFIDLNYFYRKKDSENDLNDDLTNYIGGGIRMNIANRKLDF